MTDNNDNIWEYDSLEVNEDNEVVGSAYTFEKEEHDVSVGVFSYTYEKSGEFLMNHVPNVVVSDKEGNIVAELDAHDSHSPNKAIENAKSSGRYAYEHIEEFI